MAEGRSSQGVRQILSYTSSRFRMRVENLIPVHAESVSFEFKLPLTATILTEDAPHRPLQDIINWLDTSPQARFQWIFQLGDLTGIAFEREDDAVWFKTTWL